MKVVSVKFYKLKLESKKIEMEKAYVNEIFASIQGEGLYIGLYQLFIRFEGCNLTCSYCDTDNSSKKYFVINNKKYINPITVNDLIDIILSEFDLSLYHSISFTGGEPSLQSNFIKKAVDDIKKLNKGIQFFLETNGSIPENLMALDEYMNVMSIDLKMHDKESVSTLPSLLDAVDKLEHSFYYLKLPFDAYNYKEEDLDYLIKLLTSKRVKQLIIQPLDNKVDEDIIKSLFTKFSTTSIVIRVIAQTHKFLSIR